MKGLVTNHATLFRMRHVVADNPRQVISKDHGGYAQIRTFLMNFQSRDIALALIGCVGDHHKPQTSQETSEALQNVRVGNLARLRHVHGGKTLSSRQTWTLGH